jgi:hypothetical protein
LEDEREFQDLDIYGMQSILDRYQWNEELVGRLQEELARRRDSSPAARQLFNQLNSLPGVRAAQKQQTTDPIDDADHPARRRHATSADVSAIRPVGTPDLPAAKPKVLDKEFRLPIPADVPLSTRYRVAVQAYIEERRSSRRGKMRDLYRGRRIATPGNSKTYSFEIARTDDIHEGAEVELLFEGTHKCTVSAKTPTQIDLMVGKDLGPEVAKAQLRLDDNKLLERLRDCLQSIESDKTGFNSLLADAALGIGSAPSVEALQERGSVATLNASQHEALRHALSDAVTFIWGPPGCGKTLTLGAIVRTVFEAGKRALICSTTNKAVDQVLYSICNALGPGHAALQAGQILRLGAVVDPKLAKEFGDCLDLDRIVERLAAPLRVTLNALQLSISDIERAIEPIREALSRFEQLDVANARFETIAVNLHNIHTCVQEIQQRLAAVDRNLSALAAELSGKGRWLRNLLRTREKVVLEIQDAQVQRSQLELLDQQNVAAEREALRNYSAASDELTRLADSLIGQDRSTCQEQYDALDGKLNALRGERSAIEDEIAGLRAKILGDARVIGATGTRVYLTPKDLGLLDLVIVDEASMLLQPVIWMAAGLSRERVIICGDFRQLPPIVNTDRQAIFDLLGRDVFEASGVSALDRADPRMVMLDTQYRMDELICALISQRMYEGRLRTATDPAWLKKRQMHVRPPPPFDHSLTLIDTSDLRPGEAFEGTSRFNPVHALLIRNLAHHLTQTGFATDKTALAVCTPYAAQARLISKVLKERDMAHVEVGTVHTFQGDERNAIIVDLPESPGSDVGYFLKGIRPDDIGSRLINVAVSRTQNHLIVLANLRHLDTRLPSHAFLRGMLADMQAEGRVLPAAQLFELGPRGCDLEGLEGIELDEAARSWGLFDSTTFDRGFTADIARANKSIVVFSGYISHLRVGELAGAFSEAIQQKVKIRCVTRPPTRNFPKNPASGAKAFEVLEQIGCVVDGRSRMHQKVIIIDERIVWNGSLNALSFARGTDELMVRAVSQELARGTALMLAKLPISLERALEEASKAENPRCDRCGGRMFYEETSGGSIYFECEQGCGYRKAISQSRRAPRPRSRKTNGNDIPVPAQSPADAPPLPTPVSYLDTAARPYRKQGPPCPQCHSETRLRFNSQKNTYFYGCSRFPTGQCRGTLNIPAEYSRDHR